MVMQWQSMNGVVSSMVSNNLFLICIVTEILKSMLIGTCGFALQIAKRGSQDRCMGKLTEGKS